MENDITIDIKKRLVSAQGPITLQIQTSVASGELAVLFGTSGAGKTSLLRMLAGLLKPDSGYIAVGKQIWYSSAHDVCLPPQARNIGYMFQDYALFPNMSVRENILFAQSKPNTVEANEILETFGLLEFADRKPNKLSGGQRQRVALARALARKPNLLLLDEPLSALDAQMRVSLQDEIRNTHLRSNATTLLVSHDLSEVFRLATRVIQLQDGVVTASGSPDEVFVNQSISGKTQMVGTVVKILPCDTFYLLTIVIGFNQIIKVSAFESDISNLHEGDSVMVYSKAFNPIVMKL